ncbi:hypothetical protein MCUN1_002824 [Malassezia cuniculi]|uniref:Bromo domain-containing protein n=1 Tax=Malassezia cuniculi TaxID=948313 RepID=A0AAF0J780_9BASI|nr:hypothetical protein MCUN1_002824 [Malassezia cuniculi]
MADTTQFVPKEAVPMNVDAQEGATLAPAAAPAPELAPAPTETSGDAVVQSDSTKEAITADAAAPSEPADASSAEAPAQTAAVEAPAASQAAVSNPVPQVEAQQQPAAAASVDAPEGQGAATAGANETATGAAGVTATASAPAAETATTTTPTTIHPLAPPTQSLAIDEQSAGDAPVATADGQLSDTPYLHEQIAMAHVKYAQNTIRSLKSRREASAFLQPVDPIALNIPHYTQIIKHPMDLGTIDHKLALTAHRLKGPEARMTDKLRNAIESGKIKEEEDYYTYVDSFERDVFRVFDNCKRFNGVDHIFTKNAETLRGVFEKQRKGLATAVAVANETGSPDGKPRRSSNALPTIRRSSSNGGRPKREIHPPAPRDLPWTEDTVYPASKRAIAARRGKNGEPLTPREQAYWSKVINDELKFSYRVVEELLKPVNQDIAWVFYEIPAKDFDWAPAYFATIKKPIALLPIQRKLKSGSYPDLAAFDADMQLMFRNCFTFNPPDSDVYIMGARLKEVYENKMLKKPVPPPLEPEEEEGDDDDEADDFDDEESANEVLVQQLQRQINELQGTLENLENSKTKNPVLITSTRVALNSVEAALAGAMSVSAGAGKKGKKRSSAALGKKSKDKAKPKSSAKKPRTSSEPPAQSRKTNKRSSDDEDIRTVTFDQKEELAAKITELSDERLDGAIRIINEDKPPGEQNNEDDEIELDIDELSPQTLYKLYKYVVRPKKKAPVVPEIGPGGKPVVAPAPIDGRKRGTGGLKKKNLDETEEAERIARLQQQLQQFTDPAAARAAQEAQAKQNAPVDAATQAAESSKHDDLVASDSSSGEDDDDSDSESDMD